MTSSQNRRRIKNSLMIVLFLVSGSACTRSQEIPISEHSVVLEPLVGDKGIATISLGDDLSHSLSAMAVDDQGRLVATIQTLNKKERKFHQSLIRVLPNGKLDASFGKEGVAKLAFGPQSTPKSRATIVDLEIRKDGRILVLANFTRDEDDSITTLLQMNSDGSVDTSFGTAGVSQLQLLKGGRSEARAMVLQESGSIVIAASRYPNLVFAARLDPSGRLDPRFGTQSGTAPIEFRDFGELSSTPRDIVLVPSGDGQPQMIAILGRAVLPSEESLLSVVSLLSLEGKPLNEKPTRTPEEGSWKRLGTNSFVQGAPLPQGGMILLGSADGGPGGSQMGTLSRLSPKGDFDPGFGEKGLIKIASAGRHTLVRSLALDSQGRIIVSAVLSDPKSKVEDWLIYRFAASGKPDPCFGDPHCGSSGIIRLHHPGLKLLTGANLSSDGTIWVAGASDNWKSVSFARVKSWNTVPAR